MIFVHYCVLHFAYCLVVIAEDIDAVEVCCETVVTCVELEICNCLFSRFVFILMFCHCVLLDETMASWENFSCFLFYESLNYFKVKWCLFILKCGSFFLPVGV